MLSTVSCEGLESAAHGVGSTLCRHATGQGPEVLDTVLAMNTYTWLLCSVWVGGYKSQNALSVSTTGSGQGIAQSDIRAAASLVAQSCSGGVHL